MEKVNNTSKTGLISKITNNSIMIVAILKISSDVVNLFSENN